MNKEQVERKAATVLVVDDDETLCKWLSGRLAGCGYDVAEALTGHSAVEMLSERPAEVVIMDLKMPEMDGIETARSMLKTGRSPAFIFMTGYGDIQSARQAMSLGACDFLTKPVDLGTLLDAIAENVGEAPPELLEE